MSTYVIGYDIRDPKRLARVHRKMLGFGIPIEYSVFLMSGTPGDLLRCSSVMRSVVNLQEDDVRCYRIPDRGARGHLGQGTLPAGISWSALPGELSLSEMEPEDELSCEKLDFFSTKERFFS